MKNRIFGLVGCVAVMGAIGCGASGGGKGLRLDLKPDLISEDGQEYLQNYEVSSLNQLNNEYSQIDKLKAVWNLRIVVNGVELVKLEGKSFEDVKGALNSQKYKHYDIVRTEITILSADGTILATNLKSVAESQPKLKEIWDDQCKSIPEPEKEISDVDYKYVNDEKRLVMKLSICDFAGYSLKPILEISPQQKYMEKKTVIYSCPIFLKYHSNFSNIVMDFDGRACKYGYDALIGEVVPKIEIRKDFAEGTLNYDKFHLKHSGLNLKNGLDNRLTMATKFKATPFGSFEGCHTAKLDLEYGTNSGVVAGRFIFKRNGFDSTYQYWKLEDGQNAPGSAEIREYYKDGVWTKLFLICEWLPSAETVNSGNVIEFKIGN